MYAKEKLRNVIFLMVFCFMGWLMTACPVNAQELTGKEQAVDWVMQEASADGEWKNQGLPNLTCNALAVLALENREMESGYLSAWKEQQETLNYDELSHLAWALGNADDMDEVWENQNEDGGFGLCRGYMSDPYDTLLVLMAEAAAGNREADGVHQEKVQNAIAYLVKQQKEDGGFGYSGTDISRPGLSAETGIVLQALQYEDDDFFAALDAYCGEAFSGDFTETGFHEQAELARYLYSRETIQNPEEVEAALQEIQQENGSIYGDVSDTLQYILLAGGIEKYHELRFEISSTDVELNSYVWESGCTNEVGIHTDITYKTNQDINAVLRYTVMEDGVEIVTKETEQLLAKEDTTIWTDNDEIAVEPSVGKNYVLRVEVIISDEIMDTVEVKLTIHEDIVDDLVLNADVKSGENYGVELNWNDISNDNHRYGYRVMRRRDGGEWESKSTWDGTEVVRVLNVYPNSAKFLKKWMETTISQTEEAASRGVLEVDEVSMTLYNMDPEKYLMDEEGNYLYDVIMIGSADCNGGMDLSDKAYEATLAFTNTGRGILFGHDSVVDNSAQKHANLAKFGEQLGISYHKNDTNGTGSRVEVINEGFLTSYPWKLTGVLQIPYAHSSGQFLNSDLEHPATKWMRFYGYDSSDDAYLFSRDQYAMIQTGHSYGQATDDERKILANTLFYLKQYTNDTSAADRSFYDENAPESVTVSDVVNGQVTISADDTGTKYQYYVEGVGEKTDDNVQSNIVDATALSGIKGFVVRLTDSQNPEQDILTYDEEGKLTTEILPAQDGTLVYPLDTLALGESGYLHIYAVDYAGNVSEEQMIPVTNVPAVSEKEYLNLPYALFATEDVASVSCSMANINGDVYGESSFFFQGSTLELEGTAMTPGTLSIAGGVLHLKGRQEGITPVKLPDYTDAIVNDIEIEQAPVEEITVYNSTEITSPVFCQRTTGAWCNDLSLRASLVSQQDISFNANTVTCTGENPVILCSRNGNITVQATKFNGSGLIYAPNGTVTVNVSEFNYSGTIIAKKIVFQSGYVNMNQ